MSIERKVVQITKISSERTKVKKEKKYRILFVVG